MSGDNKEQRTIWRYSASFISKHSIERQGERTEEMGINLAGPALNQTLHSIGAEKLLTRSSKISRQVYGADHEYTSELEKYSLDFIRENRISCQCKFIGNGWKKVWVSRSSNATGGYSVYFEDKKPKSVMVKAANLQSAHGHWFARHTLKPSMYLISQ